MSWNFDDAREFFDKIFKGLFYALGGVGAFLVCFVVGLLALVALFVFKFVIIIVVMGVVVISLLLSIIHTIFD